MEAIIIGLLVVAVALLVYVIVQGKNGKNSALQKEKPMAGMPNIIGRPKGAPIDSSRRNDTLGESESAMSTTDNFNNRNAGNPQASEIPQQGTEVAESTLPDWKEEEEEMRRYAAYGTEEDFATGVTFDELGIVQEMLERKKLAPSEEKTAAAIASKIDGTELLGLLESKIGDTSKRIAVLLEKGIANEPDENSSLLRNDDQENFEIRDYV